MMLVIRLPSGDMSCSKYINHILIDEEYLSPETSRSRTVGIEDLSEVCESFPSGFISIEIRGVIGMEGRTPPILYDTLESFYISFFDTAVADLVLYLVELLRVRQL